MYYPLYRHLGGIRDFQADSKWMKNKKKRPAEEMKQLKKKAKLEKVGSVSNFRFFSTSYVAY
jgi:hypothetical protein